MTCTALAVLIANAMTSWDGQRAKGERLFEKVTDLSPKGVAGIL